MTVIPTVTTPESDYFAGSDALIIGDNWGPGERVTVVITGSDGVEYWNQPIDADGAGHFEFTFTLAPYYVAEYYVVATGASGAVATTSFTDVAPALKLYVGSVDANNERRSVARPASGTTALIADVTNEALTKHTGGTPGTTTTFSYKIRWTDPSGTQTDSACQGSVAAFSSTYNLSSADELSTATKWTAQVLRFESTTGVTTCPGSALTNSEPSAAFAVGTTLSFASDADRSGCHVDATTFEPVGCALAPANFVEGATVYTRTLGYWPSVNDVSTHWTDPSPAVVCQNTVDTDRADSNAAGELDVTYPESDVDVVPGACPASTVGDWKLTLGDDSGGGRKDLVTLPAFTVIQAATNHAPTIDTLEQFKSDGTTAIAVGGYTNEDNVVLSAALADEDGDDVTFEVEVQAVGDAFAGTASDTSGPSAPGTLTVNPTGLDPGNAQTGTGYHWQARACDASLCSSWVSFPESSTNAESVADFIVDQTAPVVAISGNDTCLGATCDSNATVEPAEDRVTIDWSANEDGTYKVVVGSDCTVSAPTGTNSDKLSGTYTSEDSVTSTIDASDLAYGPNTVTVCVTDAATNTGTDDTTLWRQVPTTLTFNPPSTPPVADTGSVTVPLTATLAKSVSSTACSVANKQIDFYIDGAYLGSNTTDTSGVATFSGHSFSPGIYDIKVNFDGTTGENLDGDDCAAAGDEGVLAVITTGDAANGGGWYQLANQTGPTKRVSFGFTARWDKKLSAYKGQILVINNQAWRLKGQATAYAKTSTGNAELYLTANLFAWDTVTGTWSTTAVPVTFKVQIYDAGIPSRKTPSKTDGFTVSWVKNSGGINMSVAPLVQSALQYLKGGNITIS